MSWPQPQPPIPTVATATPMQRPQGYPCIALLAGEISGDLLGSDLLLALRARFPNAHFVGMGGPRMREAGFDAWHDIAELSVMGLSEVLRHLPRLLRLRNKLAKRLLDEHPDLIVGIDAPDFNLGLERRLKRTGLRTAHYVSPSIWAWRESRARRIAQSAERILCLFPMEPAMYARYGVEATFVGHPLADEFAVTSNQLKTTTTTATAGPLLALLPGSRHGEITRLLPIFLQAVVLLRRTVPTLRVALPLASDTLRELVETELAKSGLDDIEILNGQSHTLLQNADVALLASGTAALEAALAGCPMVVAYRIAPLTHILVKRLGMLKTQRYSLPNILAGYDLVPERIQHECRASLLAEDLHQLLCDPAAAAAQRKVFPTLRRALHAAHGLRAAEAAAAALADLLPAHADL